MAEDEGQDVGLKLEALKLLRKVEARRVVPGVTGLAPETSKETARRLGSAKRRLELIAEDKWPAAKGWEQAATPEAVMLKTDGLAERLKVAREGH